MMNAAGNGTKWLNVCVSRPSRIFLVVVSGLICQMEIWTGRKGFYILRKSWCPAVLTENFFMDTHVEGIVEWLESKKS